MTHLQLCMIEKQSALPHKEKQINSLMLNHIEQILVLRNLIVQKEQEDCSSALEKIAIAP